MAFFSKKSDNNVLHTPSAVIPVKMDYTPIRHIANSVKDYQQQLVVKEVASLGELKYIQDSFNEVLEKGFDGGRPTASACCRERVIGILHFRRKTLIPIKLFHTDRLDEVQVNVGDIDLVKRRFGIDQMSAPF